MTEHGQTVSSKADELQVFQIFKCLFLNGADVIEAKVQPLKVDQSCKIFDNDL